MCKIKRAMRFIDNNMSNVDLFFDSLLYNILRKLNL